jgi:regulator of sigma E protease
MGSSVLFDIGAVVVLLGGLIFIHELGHFLVAKAFGVKIQTFSLGFGPRLCGFRKGDTDYRLSLLPLGGYVKMAGDDPSQPLAPEDRGRGYLEQKPHRRALIALAGPGMNLIFPLLAYFVVFAGQREGIAAYAGQVIPDMPAYEAGIRPGDRIVAIDGEEVVAFADLQRAVGPRPGEALPVVVERNGQRLAFTVTPAPVDESDPIETRTVGKIGVASPPSAAVIGLPTAEGPLYEAGLRSLDRIHAVAGKTVRTESEALAALAEAHAAGAPYEVVAVRGEPATLGVVTVNLPETVRVTVRPDGRPLEAEGAGAYVTHVLPGSAADRAGLARGDRLVSGDGVPLSSWEGLNRLLVEMEDKPFTLVWTREGELHRASVAQHADRAFDEIRGREVIRYSFGAYNRVPMLAPPTVELPFRPLVAAQVAAEATWEVGRKILLSLGMLLTGQIAFNNLGGPLQIFDITAQAAAAGWAVFLHTMALISLNLGLINLFPLPVLDGGHIVQAGIEAVRRRPLSVKVLQYSNLVGIALLLTLMVFVIKNDVVRYFFAG